MSRPSSTQIHHAINSLIVTARPDHKAMIEWLEDQMEAAESAESEAAAVDREDLKERGRLADDHDGRR